MAITRKKITVGKPENGVNLTVLTDEKFKTNSITVHFINERTEKTVAENAAVSFMLEDSCKDFPDITSFSRRLSSLYGANVKFGIAPRGDSQLINASVSCIADEYALGGEELTCDAVNLLCSCIFDPVTETVNGEVQFPEKQFALKKQELIDDIEADINEKRYYAYKQASRIISRNEPSGIPVKGELEAAEALTSAQVYRAYRRILETARIEIFFTGRSFPEKCGQLITEKFSGIERKNVFEYKVNQSPLKPEPAEVTEKMDVAQSKMVMAFKSPLDRKLRRREVTTLFAVIFGGAPFSLLFKNVREKKSLCYYCSASKNDDKSIVAVESGVEQENITAAREEIIAQLECIKTGNFSEELLSQGKLLLQCALKSNFDYPSGAEDWYFALFNEPEEEIFTPAELIERINNVTAEQVSDFAKSLSLDTVYVLTNDNDN